MEVIKPSSDIAFKKLFGVEENKELLMSLINAVLDPKDRVSEIELQNPYTIKNYKEERGSIFDIRAKTNDNRMINIEMQVPPNGFYNKIALYYWSKLYAEQKTTVHYDEFAKTIGIYFLNFAPIHDSEKYHNIFHIKGTNNHSTYFGELLELHIIELGKFNKNPSEEFSELWERVNDSLDLWTAFLAEHELLEQNKNKIKDPEVKKALEVMKIMKLEPEERRFYQDNEEYLARKEAAIEYYIAEFKREEKIEIAKKMLKRGASIDDIIEDTGLYKEEIEKLIKNRK